MSIFSISDLHLSFNSEKPMDIYGGEWVNHTKKLYTNWTSMISQNDTVIIPGDISWALRQNEALQDLKWISELPGKKVLIKGNHDLWWVSISKLSGLFENIYFLQNSFYIAENYAICGTRGWICPGDDDFTAHDEKIYKRELLRLKHSLEAASQAGYGIKYKNELEQKGDIIGALHFPPTNDKFMESGFTELFEEYGVKKVVYGHLHGKDAYSNGFQGVKSNVEYILTSLDYLKGIPFKVL